MREEAEYSYLVVTKSYEAIKRSRRGVGEQVLTGFVAALCAVGYPVFIEDKWDAAVVMRKIMDKIDDDTTRLYVPRPRSPKPQEYRNALIEALPKVGIKTRRKIVQAFPSMADLCGATVEQLVEIEGIGQKTAERIVRFFMRYDYKLCLIGLNDATRRHEKLRSNLTNARANAGAIVLYEHEERNLMKAMEGLQAFAMHETLS